MFLDEVEIKLVAGHGGPGKVSFYPGFKSGPDGGNGGKGGDLYIRATTDLTALNRFSREKLIKSEDGQGGSSNRKFGKDGQDRTISLPVGTLIKDLNTGKEWEVLNTDQQFLIAKGGKGGKGNYELRSPRRTTPEIAQPGLPGEEFKVKITLRLIADFGLIGLPNAGKSSLLNELTSTSAKVANYPFTTLEPNLGVYNSKVLADIPGLIEGASTGKGLGIKFLKHIEKTEILLHCIAVDSEDPVRDYETVRNELGQYNKDLLKKKEIILLTKSDLVEKPKLKEIKDLFKKKKILAISIYNWEEMEKLKKILS